MDIAAWPEKLNEAVFFGKSVRAAMAILKSNRFGDILLDCKFDED